jgi:ribonuclease VapC
MRAGVVAEPASYVLDSFALLAYLEGEVGAPRITELLELAGAEAHTLYMSLMNMGEVLYVTEREMGLVQAQRVLATIDQLPLEIVPVSRPAVLAAAHVKAHYPVSYADAFAVVTARDLEAVLVTGDPELESVEKAGLVTIEWLPRR